MLTVEARRAAILAQVPTLCNDLARLYGQRRGGGWRQAEIERLRWRLQVLAIEDGVLEQLAGEVEQQASA